MNAIEPDILYKLFRFAVDEQAKAFNAWQKLVDSRASERVYEEKRLQCAAWATAAQSLYTQYEQAKRQQQEQEQKETATTR